MGGVLRCLVTASVPALTDKRCVALFRYTLRIRVPKRARRKARRKMRRTLGEWEKLWRERWDINDYADLDSVFANMQDYKDVICEVEILINTQEGRIETVQISLLDEEFTVLAEHEYSILELGRAERLKLCRKAIRKSQYSAPSDSQRSATPHRAEGLFLISRMALFTTPCSESEPPLLCREYRPDEMMAGASWFYLPLV